MFRTFTVVVVISLVVGLVGCRFCASPYDYCSPTFTGNNYDFYQGDPCNPNYAAGSRFLGTEDVCRCNTCNTCDGGGCSSCETESYQMNGPTEEVSAPLTRAAKPNVKSVPSPVKKIPSPPAAPAVAVPQTIQGASALKKTATQELAAPKPVLPKTGYAKQALTNSELGDPATMLNELKELNPDAVEVKIIGFEEE